MRRLAALLAPALLAGSLAVATPAQAASDFRTYEIEVATAAIRVTGTYIPLVGNFGGGRETDILWYAPGTAPDPLWLGTATDGVFTKSTKTINGTYTPIVGDLAGDDYDDILWYAPGTGADTLWTSVETPAFFQPAPMTINGTYKPTVLAAVVPSAATAASAGRGGAKAGSGAAKAEILWLRAGGTNDDWLWVMDPDLPDAGDHVAHPVDIPGTPQVLPLSLNNDALGDLFLYTPGSGYDGAWRRSGAGGFVKTPKSVSGTYKASVIPSAGFDSILWVGPGSQADALWRNFAGSLTNSLIDPVTATGPLLPTTPGQAYGYDAAGEDENILTGSGRVLDSLNTDVPAGAKPLVGDFDHNGALDAFFYLPGTGQERLYMAYNPL